MICRKFRIFSFFVKIVLSLAVFFGLERVCHIATDGFSLVRIVNSLPQHEEFQTSYPSENELNHLNKIFSQPFYYLHCGGQSYVFESSDGQYVIKFFKFHHMRIPPWLSTFYLPPSLELYRQKKLAKKDLVLKRTFRSYKTAEKYFKEESALVFLHLSETSFFKNSLKIYDKIGIALDVPLDKTAFAIQKKGVLAYEKLHSLMKNHQLDEAKNLVTDMILLSVLRCQKGIRDEDADFSKNFGFIGNTPLQLDLGRLVFDENEKKASVFIPEIHRITKSFQEWLRPTYPLLADHLENELKLLGKKLSP